jgi:small subunit ribosomal protein S3
VVIERTPQKMTVVIHTARPGVVIGRKGQEVDKLRDELAHLSKDEIFIKIEEIKSPELDSQLVADGIAFQLEQRVSFRRAMKKAVTSAMRMGAQGVKIIAGGRLAGAEIARSESYHEGRVPLHTIRADIDYATSTANTTFGTIGVKVWICKGEVIRPKRKRFEKVDQTAGLRSNANR